MSDTSSCTGCRDSSCLDDAPTVGTLEPVVCEPDTNEPIDADGVYITYAKLANLIGRANASSGNTSVQHCQGCACNKIV